MSWSFSGAGKPEALAKKAKDELARVKCAEPEETIKNSVAGIIEASLAAFPAGFAAEIRASGSQSIQPDGKAVNNLSVEIKPLWGFVE